MMTDIRPAPTGRLLRDRSKPGHNRVHYLELFFDLIFVFAVTQISHRLLKQLTLGNALETFFLFVAMWWTWVYSTWVFNWLDPQRGRVRWMTFALALACLVMAVSIPDAFAGRGLVFAVTYVAAQLGRSLFTLYAMPQGSVLRDNFVRIAIWFAASAPFWIGGGFVDGAARYALWGVALAIDVAGPVARFYVPSRGASEISHWSIDGEHMAERCALFIIIALGESLMLTGATFEKLEWTTPHWLTLLASVAATLAMWWIYFDKGSERGAHHIAHSAQAGALGRRIYTYFHAFIVAGVIVAAVGDELALAHPVGHLEPAALMVFGASSTLFLIGCALFKREIAGNFPLSHMVGLALTILALGAAWLLHWEPYQAAMIGAAALVVTAVWETRSLATGLPEARRKPS
jgi:low temperature requirement protein LtrA